MQNLIGYDPSSNNTLDILGYKHSFDLDNVYADTDAYNIFRLVEDGKILSSAIETYYDKGFYKRFSLFTNNWDRNKISSLTSKYTNCNYVFNVRWPLFEYNFTSIQSQAAEDAFVDYLMEKIADEK